MTTQVGVRELKTHLSRYLAEVKAGSAIVITEHGKPIGRIVPVAPAPPTLTERMQTLEEGGLLVWSGKKLEPRTPLDRIDTDLLVSDLLLEDRE